MCHAESSSILEAHAGVHWLPCVYDTSDARARALQGPRTRRFLPSRLQREHDGAEPLTFTSFQADTDQSELL